MKKEDLTAGLRTTRELLKQSKNRFESQNTKKNELDKGLDDQRKEQNFIRNEIHLKTSRKKMLQDMERNLEGYNRSVKVLLQATEQSPELKKGIHGALAQLITVDKRFETAIEMTLGSSLQNIVTDSEEDAKKAIDFLKQNKFGRATFLPITSVTGKSFEGNIINDIKNQKGFIGVASNLVSYGAEYKGIILSLLGKVVIVEDIDAGIRLARKYGYSFRIVTLEGDILSTSGSMSGGSNDNRSSGILSRHREISEIDELIENLKIKDHDLEKIINENISILKDINLELAKLDEVIRTNELIKLRDENHLLQIEDSISRASAKTDMLKQEKNQLLRQESESNIELEKYQKELNDVESNLANTKEIIAQHQDKHKEDQAVRDALHQDITDFKISVNSILESIESVKESIARLESDKNISIKSIDKRRSEKEKYSDEINSLNEDIEGFKTTIKGFDEEKLGKTLEMDQIAEERKIIEEELSEIITRITDINKNVVLYQEEFGRLEVKKAKLETEMEALQNRMWDEYELTFTNALAFKKDIGSIPQAQKKINELRNEIKELGPVNVSAIEEYIKTKERFEFMSVQKDDMEQAQEKLHRVIYEMTSIMKKQFIEQFKLINESFGIVFKDLFDGGRAELIIVDKENVLESGIEIEVQPPGKKLQNMMLLSGGERAFTAIALLFSILRLRPTPFCLLDEIEAALDDANVYRFAEYIKKFIGETQFIMVTHRKGTMEASDTLYGVTMQEHGVSKIVSMKMGEKAS